VNRGLQMSGTDEEIAQEPIRSVGLALPMLLFCTVLALFLVAISTNPTTGGPKTVLLLLTLFFALIIQVSYQFILFSQLLLGRQIKRGLSITISVLLAFGAVFLLGLHTLNQLSLMDVALVVTLISLISFYISRRF